uniref:Glycerol-3-phosphate O-acyltransferase 3/4 n=1 Tax=Tetraselmis sp. GSL018 TaxID=582737 RepID=A0A061S3J5_9CHLO
MPSEISPRRRAGGPLPGLRSSSIKERPDEKLILSEVQGGGVSHHEIEDEYVQAEGERMLKDDIPVCHQVFDISSLLSDAASAIMDDSFWRCFAMNEPDAWNWNVYLFPLWCGGVILRYLILFPCRLVILILGHILFGVAFVAASLLLKPGPSQAAVLEQLLRFLAQIYVTSWTGVIRYHGPRPVKRANQVWVANHTSMIDFLVLSAYSSFSVIMQLHPGWVGFMQKKVLDPQGCLYFNRTQVSDRKHVAEKMKEHVQDPKTPPLLIFPEGTCVNNEYCVMFKRGAFDLGATVCPVAIKYNKIFVDAFWNSKAMSFTRHLLNLMTSWAVVCDVYFLEPQDRNPGESSSDFAARVQQMIAKKAGLRVVPWDGYLKYYNLADKHPEIVEKRRRVVREALERFAPPDAEKPQE